MSNQKHNSKKHMSKVNRYTFDDGTNQEPISLPVLIIIIISLLIAGVLVS